MRALTVILLVAAVAVLVSLSQCNIEYPCNAAAPPVVYTQHAEPPPPPIDALLIWVDTRDPVWSGLKQKYQAKTGRGLRFDAIRLPESPWAHVEVMHCVTLLLDNLPFIRNLVVVMMRPQTLPQELLSSLPPAMAAKIKYVYHDEYIPARCLPTFNSSVIELFLHRIQTLSEHFVYFNDDTYVVRKMQPSHFFGYTETSGQQQRYAPVVSCLQTTWAAAVPPAAGSWLMQRLKKTHAAAHCYSHRVYQSTRLHRRRQKYYIRDHRPISLTKEMLRRADDEIPRQVMHNAAQCRFRSPKDLLFLVLALHVALDTQGAIHRPAPALLFSVESSTPLSKVTVRAALVSNASFVCINALDIDSEEQRRFLSDILYP